MYVPLYKCEGYIQTACINVRQTVGACESVWTSQFSVSNNRLVDIIHHRMKAFHL